MADRFTIHVVADNSKKVLEEFDKKVELALGACGEIIEGYAKMDCPVDTGLLRNSLTYAVAGKVTNISAYAADREDRHGNVRSGTYEGIMGDKEEKAVYVGSNVEYAASVELDSSKGHKVGKAHFLRDGAQNHRDELASTAKAILKN